MQMFYEPMADCTAHQPHTWQGATHESICWRFGLTHNSELVGQSQEHSYFRHGHADRPGRQEGGSRLLMPNVHMWQYGRPHPHTISVEERHTRMAKVRHASGKTRESRKDQLADRRAQ